MLEKNVGNKGKTGKQTDHLLARSIFPTILKRSCPDASARAECDDSRDNRSLLLAKVSRSLLDLNSSLIS